MAANIMLALISLMLAASPYISKVTFINQEFHLHAVGNIKGSFEVFVQVVGGIGFILALYNMFLEKKSGSPYVVSGVLVLVVGFFYNDEAIPMPLNNTLFGGELFYAFVISFILALAGLVAEWLMQDPK
jgi:hypothetical protein